MAINLEEELSPELEFQSEIQASKIMHVIRDVRKQTRGFVPEFDGLNILRSMLPIDEAMARGRQSDIYKLTNQTYRIVKHEIRCMVNKGFWQGGFIGESTSTMGLDFYDNRRDRVAGGELAIYQGTFGIYKSLLENKE